MEPFLRPLPTILVFLSGLVGRQVHLTRPGPWPECLTFTGFLLVSGIYDLEPIISTSQNDCLRMTL